jgi:hypothetical protein
VRQDVAECGDLDFAHVIERGKVSLASVSAPHDADLVRGAVGMFRGQQRLRRFRGRQHVAANP